MNDINNWDIPFVKSQVERCHSEIDDCANRITFWRRIRNLSFVAFVLGPLLIFYTLNNGFWTFLVICGIYGVLSGISLCISESRIEAQEAQIQMWDRLMLPAIIALKSDSSSSKEGVVN